MEGIGLAELDELAGQAGRAALTSSTSVCDTSQCAFPSGHAMWLAIAPRELEDPTWRALGWLSWTSWLGRLGELPWLARQLCVPLLSVLFLRGMWPGLQLLCVSMRTTLSVR